VAEGADSYSAVVRYKRCVVLLIAIVFAPGCVGTVSSTLKLLMFSLTLVFLSFLLKRLISI